MAKSDDKNNEPEVKKDERPETPEPRIYYAPARRFQLANFQKEIKEAGHIIQPEKPLQFGMSQTFRATTWEEIDFIESRPAFKKKTIRRANSMKDALMQVNAQNRAKATVTETVSVESQIDGQDQEPTAADLQALGQ